MLFSEAGYKYVDVRPAFEFDDAGHCKQAINVPVMNLERKWSPEEQKKARHFCRLPFPRASGQTQDAMVMRGWLAKRRRNMRHALELDQTVVRRSASSRRTRISWRTSRRSSPTWRPPS